MIFTSSFLVRFICSIFFRSLPWARTIVRLGDFVDETFGRMNWSLTIESISRFGDFDFGFDFFCFDEVECSDFFLRFCDERWMSESDVELTAESLWKQSSNISVIDFVLRHVETNGSFHSCRTYRPNVSSSLYHAEYHVMTCSSFFLMNCSFSMMISFSNPNDDYATRINQISTLFTYRHITNKQNHLSFLLVYDRNYSNDGLNRLKMYDNNGHRCLWFDCHICIKADPTWMFVRCSETFDNCSSRLSWIWNDNRPLIIRDSDCTFHWRWGCIECSRYCLMKSLKASREEKNKQK
jgi:hypothetical protein